jgi:tRNA pseudouridine13 synthase
MKLKQSPDDFVVEELTDVTPGPNGEFAFYRLDKTGWTTPDALAAVRRRWQIDARRLGYGGLKDRHARTSQYLSIYRGPRRNLAHERIAVTYLGQVAEPYSSQHIRANRFAVTLRALPAGAVEAIRGAAVEVAAVGLPNYFDDQRFGSVGGEGDAFIAREMVHGRFEEALRLALTAPYEFDRADAKREKESLRRLWGDWPACKAALPRGHSRSLTDYLAAHPTDFRGAVARLRPELQGLYLSAYQSHVWNRVLARWLAANVPPESLIGVQLRLGEVPAPRAVPADVRLRWESLVLPLPSARLKPEPSADWLPLLTEVLAEDGLTLDRMRIPGLDKPFFSKGDRPACLRPAGLTVTAAADDRHPGRTKAELRFDLPRGSYATMLVKRVTG